MTACTEDDVAIADKLEVQFTEGMSTLLEWFDEHGISLTQEAELNKLGAALIGVVMLYAQNQISAEVLGEQVDAILKAACQIGMGG